MYVQTSFNYLNEVFILGNENDKHIRRTTFSFISGGSAALIWAKLSFSSLNICMLVHFKIMSQFI